MKIKRTRCIENLLSGGIRWIVFNTYEYVYYYIFMSIKNGSHPATLINLINALKQQNFNRSSQVGGDSEAT